MRWRPTGPRDARRRLPGPAATRGWWTSSEPSACSVWTSMWAAWRPTSSAPSTRPWSCARAVAGGSRLPPRVDHELARLARGGAAQGRGEVVEADRLAGERAPVDGAGGEEPERAVDLGARVVEGAADVELVVVQRAGRQGDIGAGRAAADEDDRAAR